MEHLAPEVWNVLFVVVAALALASLAVAGMSRLRPDRDHRELVHRVRTWWIIVGLFLVALIPSPTSAVWFLAFVSFLALKEFLSMTPTRRADRRVLFYAYAAIIAQYYFASIGWYGMFIVFVPVMMFVVIPTRMILIGRTDGFLRAAGTLHWAMMLTVFSLSHAAFLLVMQPGDVGVARLAGNYPSDVSQAYPGPGLLLFLVLLTELNDIFQYCWGKLLGKRPIAPTVSPGKTYAGFIGGAATTILLATMLGPELTLMDRPRSALAGIVIAFAGFLGDLCLSALKRDLKIKDFGATLPGHGGVLDRVDSLIFTAPLFFHFVYFMYG